MSSTTKNLGIRYGDLSPELQEHLANYRRTQGLTPSSQGLSSSPPAGERSSGILDQYLRDLALSTINRQWGEVRVSPSDVAPPIPHMQRPAPIRAVSLYHVDEDLVPQGVVDTLPPRDDRSAPGSPFSNTRAKPFTIFDMEFDPDVWDSTRNFRNGRDP